MSVYKKWLRWQKRTPGIEGQKYATLYARLTRSPAARRCWQG